MIEENYMEGIYNYCDRWCERCSFTQHCRIYQPKEDFLDVHGYWDKEKFWQSIHDAFVSAMDGIKKSIGENGQDWDDFYQEAMNIDIKEPELSENQKKLVACAKNYYQKTQTWLENHRSLFHQKDQEINQQHVFGMALPETTIQLTDALEVVQWYLFFIYVKVKRACKGAQDDWMQNNYPIQNDANGTAKVALLATQRSLVAWEVILINFPEKKDELLDVLVLLYQLNQQLPKEFSELNRFVRPGFDEEVKVM